ncbi:MAG: pantetheine-phosphate adenylyltransferase [Neisseriaceae bacterium]|nr:pantetheine-phosphate adenylyltransferase [Neisseriaceae bacterium]
MNKPTQRLAVYAGSFDPPTNGHLWMIRTAHSLFDELVVAVGENPEKHCTYSFEERVAMLKAACNDLPHVKITAMKNRFLVEYAASMNATHIVRGIRSVSDYEFERSMRHINGDMQPEITTVFLMPPREFAEVSSTMVKGLIGPENWQEVLVRYVPEPVYEKIVQDFDSVSNEQ